MEPSGWVSRSSSYLRPRMDGQGDAWTEEAASRGGRGSHRVTEVGEVVPAAVVAEALGLEAGEKAVVRRRVILFDDRPVELMDSYFPAAIALGTRLAEPGKIPGGTSTEQARLGFRAHRVREDITARLPTAAEREALEMVADEPVLVMIRRVVSQADQPLEVSVMTTGASGRCLSYEMIVD